MPTDLSHIDAWIFDLDNTLYPASTHLFGQIDKRMNAFVARELNLSLEDAHDVQKRYYRTYGTTLRGLMIHHGVDADKFLDDVHDIDHAVLAPDPALTAALSQLRGRRFIYTNGTAYHATQVVTRLGIASLFEGIFDIRSGKYMPKPDPAPYLDLIAQYDIAPARAAMFEDSFKNLKPAADLGMTTVWVRHPEHVPGPGDDLRHCHYVTEDLVAWLNDALKAQQA